MKLGTSEYHVTIKNRINVWTDLYGKWEETMDSHKKSVALYLHRTFARRTMNDDVKMTILKNVLDRENITVSDKTQKMFDSQEVEDTIQHIMNFFSEFEFEPNFRFINSFTYACNDSYESAVSYIENYFELIDSPYTNTIVEKMKSSEFRQIYDKLSNVIPTHKVNNRFKLYYGSQGTGKTTTALKETNNNCMVCHSAMLPSDLMEDFKFENGQATFRPSVLQNAMTKGEKIVLDEINLLPFESLRFLQSILDGKTQFSYKGKDIHIKEGFQIIGTMNLKVNGCIYSLPEPLVDRAEKLKKFNLTAKNLVSAII